MIKFSSSFKLNEIHRVHSPFNGDPKNIIFFPREALISGKGRPENLGKMGNNKSSAQGNCPARELSYNNVM